MKKENLYSKVITNLGRPGIWILGIVFLYLCLQITFGFAIFTDDPFISFRYARNIADGHGVVFNHGERVEGYTNFLWVMILSGIIRLGGEPVFASKCLGIVCNFLTLILLISYSRRLLGQSWTWIVAPLCLVFNQDFIRWGGGGLETPLFILCVTASLVWVFYQHPAAFALTGLAGACAALTRPEGLWICPVMALCVWIINRKTDDHFHQKPYVRWILYCWFLIVIPYHVWRITYFGEIFPNTFYCKISANSEQWCRGLMYTVDFLRNNGHHILVWGIFGACLGYWKRLWPLILVNGIFVLCVVFEGGDWMPFHRFLLPILPAMLLLMTVGLDHLSRHITHNMLHGNIIIIILFLCVMSQPLLPKSGYVSERIISFRTKLLGIKQTKRKVDCRLKQNISRDEQWIENPKLLGLWLKENAPEDSKIALGAAGIIPYYSELNTVDFFGLVTPEIAHGSSKSCWKLPSHIKYDKSVVLGAHPDYIFFSSNGNHCNEPIFWLKKFNLFNNEYFRENYEFKRVIIEDRIFSFYEIKKEKIGSASTDPLSALRASLPIAPSLQ
ncbi:hypothetical protein K8T06_06610 [bacterium]|nr:hypothetical protein [bacterium]